MNCRVAIRNVIIISINTYKAAASIVRLMIVGTAAVYAFLAHAVPVSAYTGSVVGWTVNRVQVEVNAFVGVQVDGCIRKRVEVV